MAPPTGTCPPPLLTRRPLSVCGSLLLSSRTLTGDAMPQIDMNVKSRRGGTRHNTCKANGLVNGHVPGTGIVNGTASHNRCPASAAKNSESTPAGILNGTKPQHMVNGYVNHWHRGKCTKAVPPRMLRKRGDAISAVTDASAGVSSRDISNGVSVNGAASLDIVALLGNCEQTAPGPSLSASAAAVKDQRRRKKFRRKKRDTEVASVPPQEEEDWESEIRDVTVTGWEEMCFGCCPYGPEDVLHFALRDLTLKQRDQVVLPANYSPAKRHLRPVEMSYYYTLPEPGQFEDADE
ncbi:uncharacterized protein LOC118123308 [Hippoglossus stenolepis]|uniref:uncharacterized protein LOC118123308 n=1 Tax=Hippoglossus stenolepis TaxID=195615 RepID=UPI001FAF2FF4|nr:uncharacterized protein LOC118123308 [Hippoglossus stenolepis]